MVDLATTLEFLSPYFSTVEGIIGALSVFVGGIFGVYLLALILRFITMRNIMKSHKDIKESLVRVETKLDKVLKPKKKSKKK